MTESSVDDEVVEVVMLFPKKSAEGVAIILGFWEEHLRVG